MITTQTVARWQDQYGNTYEWPQGLADNRRTRVLARIARRRIDCDPTTLTLTREARITCSDPGCPVTFAHTHTLPAQADEAHFLYGTTTTKEM